MSRWIEMLARESAKGTSRGTDKTDKTSSAGGYVSFDSAAPDGFSAVKGSGEGVSSVLTVPEVVHSGQSRPAAYLPAIRPEVLALVGLTDQEAGTMSARFAMLRRAGHGTEDAERIADTLLQRDRLGLDHVACLECRRLSGRRCTAGEPVGLAHELRRCPAFKAIA